MLRWSTLAGSWLISAGQIAENEINRCAKGPGPGRSAPRCCIMQILVENSPARASRPRGTDRIKRSLASAMSPPPTPPAPSVNSFELHRVTSSPPDSLSLSLFLHLASERSAISRDTGWRKGRRCHGTPCVPAATRGSHRWNSPVGPCPVHLPMISTSRANFPSADHRETRMLS